MICDQVELRLLKLLDKRSSITEFLCSDHPLAGHCRLCSSCAETAAALELLATTADEPGGAIPPCPDLADRVVATLHTPAAPPEPPVATCRTAGPPLHYGAGSLLAAAMAACVVVAISLQWPTASQTPLAETTPSVKPGSAVAATQRAPTPLPELPWPENQDAGWYPRGWGLTSLSLAMIRSHANPATGSDPQVGEPLFERAVEMLRQVWPDQDHEAQTPGSETGFWKPASPRWV